MLITIKVPCGVILGENHLLCTITTKEAVSMLAQDSGVSSTFCLGVHEMERGVSVYQPECACQCTLTCFADPLQVSVELSLNLLLSPQLEELAPVLHSFSLFGKFTAGTRFIISLLFFFPFQMIKTQAAIDKSHQRCCCTWCCMKGSEALP